MGNIYIMGLRFLRGVRGDMSGVFSRPAQRSKDSGAPKAHTGMHIAQPFGLLRNPQCCAAQGV